MLCPPGAGMNGTHNNLPKLRKSQTAAQYFEELSMGEGVIDSLSELPDIITQKGTHTTTQAYITHPLLNKEFKLSEKFILISHTVIQEMFVSKTFSQILHLLKICNICVLK